MQQLTCNIDLSNYFYYLFFSFVLLELKPFVFKVESPGGKILKKRQKVLAWPPPAEPRGEKKLFFVKILGGEKLLKFVEKCR